jgi:hypothetical protein
MFKACTKCKHFWNSRNDFLSDPATKLVGYQVDYRQLKEGIFLFNHSCGTTMALAADTFADLYGGPVFSEQKTGSEECPGYCHQKEELKACTLQCECAYVREIIQIIKQYDKKNLKP